ncbi:MAG: reverse transcriptase family protein [Pseudomonadota bacterium]
MAPTDAFSTFELPQLTTADALADWVGLSLDQLAYHSDLQNRFEEHGDMAVNHYHYHLKPKSTGGQRVIEAPKKRLKTIQRCILTGILDHVAAHPDTFGFVRGRNCLDGAARHAGEQAVLCFDLKDFFPSIGYARVFGLFRCLGYPHTVARYLSAFCTNVTPSRIVEHMRPEDRPLYKTPHLPQGAPTSPSLANLLAYTLDNRLSALARSLNANFSRYADDLAFSGDSFIAATLMRTVPGIVEEEGFALNTKKTRVTSALSRQSVTGVVVNQHLNIDRKTFDRLKAIIHACGQLIWTALS